MGPPYGAGTVEVRTGISLPSIPFSERFIMRNLILIVSVLGLAVSVVAGLMAPAVNGSLLAVIGFSVLAYRALCPTTVEA